MKLIGVFFDPTIKSDDGKDRVLIVFNFGEPANSELAAQSKEVYGFSATIGQPAEQLLNNIKKFAEDTEKKLNEKGGISGTNQS